MVAAAIMRALSDDALARAAREENERLVRDRADYHRNMLDVESGYELLVQRLTNGRGSRTAIAAGG
jgi:hypothetical protein